MSWMLVPLLVFSPGTMTASEFAELRATRQAPEGIWDAIAECESGGDWHEGDGGMGPFRGGLQWHPTTWASVRAPDAPSDAADASRAQEIAAAERLMAEPWGGLHHWPTCARQLGLLND